MNEMTYKRNLDQRTLPLERRLNMRLMAFWWDRRADRHFPTLEDFDPEALSDVWNHCFTICPAADRGKSAFKFVGDTIARASGIEEKPSSVEQIRENCLLDHATRNLDEVLTQKVPVIRSGEFENEDGQTIMFRSILLPLSEDQTNVDHLVGGARCKVKWSS